MRPQIGEAFGELRIVGQGHAALASRDDLDRVEAENRGIAVVAGADLAPQILAADRVRGVLDNTKAVAIRQRADFAHLARLAGEMHGHHDLGQPALRRRDFKLLGQRRDAHIVGPRIDVDEVDAGAAIQRAIGRCHKGIRRRPERVAGAEIEREAGDVQRCRRIGYRDRAAAAAIGGHRLLEPGAGLSLGQPVRAQHLGDRLDVLSRDVLTSIRDHWTAIRLNSLISDTSRK